MVSGGLVELREAVEGLDVAPATDELVAVLEVRDRLDAKVVEALSVFLRSGGPAADGFSNHRSWLRAHVAVTEREASLLVTWAKRAVDWPVLATLWFDGELSGAQYAVVCSRIAHARLQNARLVELYADHDAEVSPLLVGLSVSDTRTAIDAWAEMAESVLTPDPADVEVPEPGDPLPVDGELRVSRYGDGVERGMISGDVDSDSTTTIQKALAAAMPALVEGDTRSHAQRQAEAWVRICQFFLDHADCDGGRGKAAARMLVVAELADLYRNALWGLGVHTADDLERLLAVHPVSIVEEGWLRHALAHSTGQMRTIEGWPLSAPEVTRLFGKGSTLERVMLADGQVLDHGRKVRLYTGGIRDVILVRDKGCRFTSPTGEPCDAPVPWLHAHHAEPWEQGGDTSTANGVALCPLHHALVHTEGWSLTSDPDGTIHVTTPDGTILTGHPPSAHQPPRLPLHHPTIDAIPKRLPDTPSAATTPAVGPSRCLPAGPADVPEPDDALRERLPDRPADQPEPLDALPRPLPDEPADPSRLAEVPGDAARPTDRSSDVLRPTDASPLVDSTNGDDRPEGPESTGRTTGWNAADGMRSVIRVDDRADAPEPPDDLPGGVPDQPAGSPHLVDLPADVLETTESTAEVRAWAHALLARRAEDRGLVCRAVGPGPWPPRYPDLVVTMPDGEELWLQITTAA